MTPFWSSSNGETTLTLYQGHVLEVLRAMFAESVQCVVTSPPYWGLRDYKLEPQVWGGAECAHRWGEEIILDKSKPGTSGSGLTNEGQSQAASNRFAASSAFCLLCGAWRGSLGLEPTPDLYAQHLVEMFREVRRVLRRDGTLWLNMGDAYHNGDKGGYQNSRTSSDSLQRSNLANDFIGAPNRQPQAGLKPKDLLGMPWRVAFALQADGWWLRSALTWCKENPMPESVIDRPTTATEMVFLLTRSARYYYDSDAVSEPSVSQVVSPLQEGDALGLFLPPEEQERLQLDLQELRQDAREGMAQDPTGGGVGEAGRSEVPSDGKGTGESTGECRITGQESTDRPLSSISGREKHGCTIPDESQKQSAHEAVLLQPERQGSDDPQVHEATVGDGSQPPDRRGLGADPKSLRPQVRLLREEGRTDDARPLDSPVIGRSTLEGEHRTGLSSMQRPARKQDALGKQTYTGFNARWNEQPVARRNLRNYWILATEPYPEAHFATYPQKLVEPCILAGTSEKGCCPECGAPWERVTHSEPPPKEVFTKTRVQNDVADMIYTPRKDGVKVGAGQRYQNWRNENPTQTVGWRPACSHDLPPQSCTVLDPFAGSGTTLLVAQRLGRHGVGIELNSDYCRLAVKRLEGHAQQRLVMK